MTRSDEIIYLDFNATTPVLPAVIDILLPLLQDVFGNPSSSHGAGIRAKAAVDKARRQTARAIGATAEEVIFTAGGTESNNLALKGCLAAVTGAKRHIVTSAVEHPAILEVCRWLERRGVDVSYVPVNSDATVDIARIVDAVRGDTLLVSVQHANNEVGSIQPIRDIVDAVKASGVLVHTDAAQSMGKIPVDVNDLGVDLLSLAGHKFYAPKGVGVLYVREGTPLKAITHGAAHERGLRPGTENTAFIAALGEAAALARSDLEENMRHFTRCRDRLEELITQKVPPELVRINGASQSRLPNTTSISFRNVEANTLLAEIGHRVAASAGAACHAEEIDVSEVLAAMKVPEEWAMGTVRFSVGRSTTVEEVEAAAEIVLEAVSRLQSKRAVVPSATEEVRLTRFTKGLGCACKIRPEILEQILKSSAPNSDPNILVDMSMSDDAAVYRLSDELALVSTTDFFTPIVDDPFDFGAISAANSLSDIYAMGATPTYALNIVAFPSQRLPLSVLKDILRGASEKCREAGVSVVGGHTIDDPEPKFGLAVTGTVRPTELIRNRGGASGDCLVLTKPLGTGIIATGAKRGLATEDETRAASESMAALNKRAAESLFGLKVHACTDVTGFGLLGHLLEMIRGSQVDAAVHSVDVPFLRGAERLAAAREIPGGTVDNLRFVKPHTSFDSTVGETTQLLLADAQTSGGLLVCLPEESAAAYLNRLGRIGEKGWVIGRLRGGEGRIYVS